MTLLALDIGGANLKAADGLGWAESRAFVLRWKPEKLADELAKLAAAGPAASRLAVTMTGELCDCFRTKREGVEHILGAVKQVAAGRDVVVYLTDGRLVSIDEAREEPLLAAASNWHALARFACQFLDGESGVLIDVGSTSTDVIPLAGGRPVPTGLTDAERLLAGELVYSGIAHTPLCALVRTLPWRGQPCPVSAELFATTADAYLLLGAIDEAPDADWTADGRPLTSEFAHERIARTICADRTQMSLEEAREAAAAVREAHLRHIGHAVEQVVARQSPPPGCFVTSGAGEFVAASALKTIAGGCSITSLTEQISAAASRCAPAHALARLALLETAKDLPR